MANLGTFDAEMAPIYVDLGNTKGAYVVEPGENPFIALHVSLKDKQKPMANIVYNALLSFHRSLAPVYRLFPLIQFYEDLPEAVEVPAQVEEPEIIIFARAPRRWGHAAYEYPEKIRVIGLSG